MFKFKNVAWGLIITLVFGGGVFAAENVVVVNAYPVIWADPAVGSDWYDTEVIYNLYDPLVYPTPEGTVRPHLAVAWEAVEGNLAHWRFQLRRGVKFHDGSEMDAEDVAWSMNRFITMGRGNSGPLGKVKAEVVDRYTVDFFLEKPNALFPELLCLFFPVNKEQVLAHIQPGPYGEFGDYGEEWLSTHDAGTGPYMMVTHIPGQRLEAVRFPDYFLGWDDPHWKPEEVPIERVIFIMETDYTTLMTLLQAGDLDLEWNGGWTLPQLLEIQKNPRFRVEHVWGQNLTVWLNTKKPPTDDEHFRKAILYAFDYEAIIEPYLPLGYTETGVLPYGMPGYVSVEPQPRVQNLARARQELALSKYANRLQEVKVEFHYCGGLAFEEEIGLQLQADLAKLGVKVEVVGPPWPQYSAECASPGTTPNMTIFLFAPQVFPPHDYYTYCMYHPLGLGWIFSAHWYFEDPKILELLEQTRAMLDFEDRLQIYKQLQPMIVEHALALFPYYKPTPFVCQAYIAGPKEKIPMVGPSESLYFWRINLKLKEQMGK